MALGKCPRSPGARAGRFLDKWELCEEWFSRCLRLHWGMREALVSRMILGRVLHRIEIFIPEKDPRGFLY